jgi:bacterioferritin-associated ferredoxin
MTTTQQKTATRQKTVCYCLRVTDTEIKHAIEHRAAETVRDVMDTTGAGSGCTACHCAIRKLLGGRCPSA